MPSIGTGPRPADRVLPRTEGDLDKGQEPHRPGQRPKGGAGLPLEPLPLTDEHH